MVTSAGLEGVPGSSFGDALSRHHTYDKGGNQMTLSAPTKPVWSASMVLGVLALLSTVVAIPVVTGNAFWVLAAAFIVLAISTMVKGV